MNRRELFHGVVATAAVVVIPSPRPQFIIHAEQPGPCPRKYWYMVEMGFISLAHLRETEGLPEPQPDWHFVRV